MICSFIFLICLVAVSGKLVLVICSPHFSDFSVTFPIAEEFSKRLSGEDRIIFAGSVNFKNIVDRSPKLEFFDIFPGMEGHWEKNIEYNRRTKWKDNEVIWPGITKAIKNLNVKIRSLFSECEIVEKNLHSFEKLYGKPDFILVNPLLAGGKSYARKNSIPVVTISPYLLSAHPFAFGYPNYMGISRVDEMSFFQSILENFLWMIFFLVNSIGLILDPRGVYKDILDKSSPIIHNSFIGFEYPTYDTQPHYVKFVGLIPYRRDHPPLGKDIQEFLDDHPNTVYVSSGTSILWPGKVVENVFRSLEKLNIPVIASVNHKARKFFNPEKKLFDSESYENDIIFVDWINQYQILRHSSIKLFISHGGLGGMTETMDAETPVFVIPVASDQFANSVRVEEKGIGERIKSIEDFKDGIFEKKLKKMYANVTSNDCFYGKNLRMLNQISRHQGGVVAASDFLEELLLMDGYEHMKTFENPHKSKIVLFFIFCFVLCLLFVFVVGCCCGKGRKMEGNLEKLSRKKKL